MFQSAALASPWLAARHGSCCESSILSEALCAAVSLPLYECRLIAAEWVQFLQGAHGISQHPTAFGPLRFDNIVNFLPVDPQFAD